MGLVVSDRIQETSSTAGTGTLTLSGAVTGYKTFSTGIGNGNTTYYTIFDSTANVWEVGLGTVGAGTLSRDTVLSNSSNTTSLISFAGNTINVWCDYPATQSVYKNASGEAIAPAMVSSNGITVNAQAVSSSYTIATGYNGFSAGPVSVNSGVTVTIADGSLWVVL
jgi:hypothetical protein